MKTHAPPFLLKEIKLEVTHACLLRCIHCSSMACNDSVKQMTWEDCRRILTEAAEMGVEEVAFSGGEPLLWQHLKKAVAYASERGMKLALYTTGIAPDAFNILVGLKAAGLSRVMFSMFGSASLQHESVTVTEGSYDASLAAVRNCVSLGFNVEFHFVPMAMNYLELRPVAELARKLGVKRVSVLRLVPQGRGAAHGDLTLCREENKVLREAIKELREEGHNIRVGSPYNALMMKTNPECCAGIDRLTISPNLRISPCDAFKQVNSEMLGVSDNYSSLRGNLLVDVWLKSSYLQTIREYLTTPFADVCTNCKSFDRCLSGCVAQKFYAHGTLKKCQDPMCLMRYRDNGC